MADPTWAAGPAAYRSEIGAHYDRTWTALVRALARENLPLRAVARDSGVISSDDTVTPIGLWADCGTIGDDRLEGEALVSFTLFVRAQRQRHARAGQLQDADAGLSQGRLGQAQAAARVRVRLHRPLRGEPARDRARRW